MEQELCTSNVSSVNCLQESQAMCDKKDSDSRENTGFLAMENSSVRDSMLKRVAESNAHFKHQQRGEPDLTRGEKWEIAESILNKSEKSFLARFWQHLTVEDIDYFSNSKEEYEINFYLQQIKNHSSVQFNTKTVKNRRYEAMKELEVGGEYFSEEEMKYRDPYLYEQLVGRYLTDEEVNSQIDKSDLRFSTILLKHMDQLDENELYRRDKEKEEGQMEEEDTSEEEDSVAKDEEKGTSFHCYEIMNTEYDDDMESSISDERKSELKQEFTRIMQERFMAGQDVRFDYSSVDYNTKYDNLDILDKDEEEKYFQTDDADDSSNNSTSTEKPCHQASNSCDDSNIENGSDVKMEMGSLSSRHENEEHCTN